MPKNKKPTYDFSGYATKVGLKCMDGRTIMQDAFADCDGKKVPLVYQHCHNDIRNMLGHAILENRKDGVYAYCSLNNSENGKIAKEAIAHGDIKALSIYANSLVEKSKNVIHGVIREVSVVIAGANPDAYIDNIAFAHADGSITTDESEVVICAGAIADADIELPGALAHAEKDEGTKDEGKKDEGKKDEGKKDDDDEETIGDVFETLSEKQKNVVYAMIAGALKDKEGEDDDDEDEKDDADDKKVKHSNIKGENPPMKKNIFDKGASTSDNSLQHDALDREGLRTIFSDARASQSTLKNAFLAHGYESITEAYKAYTDHDTSLRHTEDLEKYGIENIGYLFPDYKATSTSPAFLKRDTDWVTKVFGAAKHVPFSRIKTVVADITADEARARGYITGTEKKDEVISLLKRTTDPQTIYKKQKLDRDDILDITDFDVVVWLRAEMRMMLEEELARAALISDGRSASSDDKIKEDRIRPIATDAALYTVNVEMDEDTTTAKMIDEIILGRKKYKGSGTPSFFTTPETNGDMLLLKDTTGRRLYNTETDLAAGIRAKEIVEVPVMENMVVVTEPATEDTDGKQKRLLGIMVNMADYSIGADKGGSMTMFDDFDIDFNQYKYLIETRCSGALTMPHSAIAYWKTESIPKSGAEG